MAQRTRQWSWVKVSSVATVASWGIAAATAAGPTPDQILRFTPRQPGVDCTTPTAQQVAACKVNLVKGKKGSGYLMVDAAGNPLRKFDDSNGDNKIDTWSFYKDGVEVYREVDSNANGKPDQYRWFNGAGSKWGVDLNEDGRIDSWSMISPEEVSQEVLQAVATRDFARLQALLLTEAEIKALDLSAAEAQKIRASLQQVQVKFNEVVGQLKDMDKASWIHLEAGLPQCRPAEQAGVGQDLVHYTRCSVLYEAAGKNDWLQLGEMIKVGPAWRLVAAPTVGQGSDMSPSPMGGGIAASPKAQKLMEELGDLDKNQPQSGGSTPNAEVLKYNLKRADLIEQIVAEMPQTERETWIRQLADSLATAVQNSAADDTVAAGRLEKLEKQLVEAMPGSSLTAAVVYRRMQAEYSVTLLKPGSDYAKVQAEWQAKLQKFVESYPKSDDAADALLQLGMAGEFVGKDADAKKWYAQLVSDFSDKPQAAKAKGAVRRLDCEGKEIELTGPRLDGSAYDVSAARGKVVVVYYWASWNQQSSGDFVKLKQMMDANAGKGVELVCINLDSSAEEAKTFINRVAAAGIHLHQAGGLDSKLACDYGIMVLPHLFLVGKDGKVVSRTVQTANVEEEVKKLMK